jgi:uncharacterized repeat protein (TIGR04076 family)
MANTFEDWWNAKVRITCEEKHGVCEHEVGDTFVFEHVQDYAEGLCSGIQDPVRPYAAYCAMGQPSWESDDKSVYRIHCVSKKGTIWRIEGILKDK